MVPSAQINLVECPRDAMQGWPHLIPSALKVEYLGALLEVGFHTLDAGSFVSPKAIPQMADTAEVLKQLNLSATRTKLLTIVANERGAREAVMFDDISYVGFPFSISETFQLRNTNSGIEASMKVVEEIQNLCVKSNKQLVIYISMGFGNPYGDAYSPALVEEWISKMVDLDVKTISLADTVGIATPETVYDVASSVIKANPQTEIGVHLHSSRVNWKEKTDAALRAGVLRFDGALKGIGGCPMADDVLIGNMDTELLIPHFQQLNLLHSINEEALLKCGELASKIFI